jgi:hypothetical protein
MPDKKRQKCMNSKMAANYPLEADLCDDPELIDPELDPPLPQNDPFPSDV